jgi:hypothetical protein
MASHKISLAFTTFLTILNGIIPPSHAESSCPLGFTNKRIGTVSRCAKEVSFSIKNTCADQQFPKLRLRDGIDLCSKNDFLITVFGPLTGREGVDFIKSIPDPEAKNKAEKKLRQESDSGFINPSVGGISGSQRQVFFTDQTVVIDGSRFIEDITIVKFNIIIAPSAPFNRP